MSEVNPLNRKCPVCNGPMEYYLKNNEHFCIKCSVSVWWPLPGEKDRAPIIFDYTEQAELAIDQYGDSDHLVPIPKNRRKLIVGAP